MYFKFNYYVNDCWGFVWIYVYVVGRWMVLYLEVLFFFLLKKGFLLVVIDYLYGYSVFVFDDEFKNWIRFDFLVVCSLWMCDFNCSVLLIMLFCVL